MRAALRPIAHIGQMKAPVLIAAGGADLHTTLPETRRLFAAAAQPKELWVVEGAAHVDLHAYVPADYERRIGAFLARQGAPKSLRLTDDAEAVRPPRPVRVETTPDGRATLACATGGAM